MNRPVPPERVPTLTEVVEAPPTVGATPPPIAPVQPVAAGAGSPVANVVDDPELAERVMASLQAHVDQVLDARIRAALEPLLQQLLVRITEETRRELASTLRDAVTRALAHERSRHRDGIPPR